MTKSDFFDIVILLANLGKLIYSETVKSVISYGFERTVQGLLANPGKLILYWQILENSSNDIYVGK